MFAGRLSLSSCRVVKSNDIQVRLNSLMNLASIIPPLPPPCNSTAHTKVPWSSKYAVKKSYRRRSPSDAGLALCFYSAAPCSVAYYTARATARLLSKRATYWQRLRGHFIRAICTCSTATSTQKQLSGQSDVSNSPHVDATKGNLPEKELYKLLLTYWGFLQP